MKSKKEKLLPFRLIWRQLKGKFFNLHLTPDQMASALGIALGQPPHPTRPGFMGGDSKLLTAAMPSVQLIPVAGAKHLWVGEKYTGIVLDLFTGSLLGLHALSLSVIVYLALRFRARLRSDPPQRSAA